MRILIAEDDFTSRGMLAAVLKKAGHEPVETVNGLEAWEALQQPDAPRLVILDWMMPEMDGLEVCRRIRQSGGAYTYIVMQTAKRARQDIAVGYAAGADDYLVKPLNIDELKHRLRVAERILSYEAELAATHAQMEQYAEEMEKLADERARQLVHGDRMATLGTLSAGIAHEINNPASFIAGNAQTMERAWDIVRDRLEVAGAPATDDSQLAFVFEEFPGMLAGIRSGVERISRIVNGLKSYARKDRPEREAFVLATAIDEALELCRNALKYNVSVEKHIPMDLPQVIGDRRQIEQVFVNLFTNAADAMARLEQGTLGIAAETDGTFIRIRVEDSGPGLKPDVMERLFDPFFTTKKEGKGTGLGLSISKGIVEEHGGVLTVENKAGRGAAFTFTLPITGEVEKENCS